MSKWAWLLAGVLLGACLAIGGALLATLAPMRPTPQQDPCVEGRAYQAQLEQDLQNATTDADRHWVATRRGALVTERPECFPLAERIDAQEDAARWEEWFRATFRQ